MTLTAVLSMIRSPTAPLKPSTYDVCVPPLSVMFSAVTVYSDCVPYSEHAMTFAPNGGLPSLSHTSPCSSVTLRLRCASCRWGCRIPPLCSRCQGTIWCPPRALSRRVSQSYVVRQVALCCTNCYPLMREENWAALLLLFPKYLPKFSISFSSDRISSSMNCSF